MIPYFYDGYSYTWYNGHYIEAHNCMDGCGTHLLWQARETCSIQLVFVGRQLW